MRTRRALFGFLVGLLVLLVVALTWPRERLLTTVAHPIMPLDGRDGREQFGWRSDHELLLLTEPSVPQAGRQDYLMRKDWNGSAELRDISTGRKTPLPGLTALLRHLGAYPRLSRDGFLVPDGKRLLWRSTLHYADFLNPRLADLDGGHYRAWNGSPLAEVFCPDNAHIIQLRDSDPMLIVHDLGDPAKDRKYAGMEDAQPVLAQVAREHPLFLELRDRDATDSMDSFAIDTYRMEDRLALLLAPDSPDRKAPHPIRSYVLKLPQGAKQVFGRLSPQQRSVCYSVEVAKVHPVVAWLQKKMAAFHPKPEIREELWVSRVDGRDMHEIGYVPNKVDEAGFYEDGIENFQWLPSGKQVSFVYHGTLYVTSVE